VRYSDLIEKVKIYSGFSDDESKDAIDCLVETLAVRLSEPERKDFAEHLPDELKGMALSVYPSDENSRPDILRQFMVFQHVNAGRARKQFLSAWQALKDTVSVKEIERIRTQLPKLNHLLR
jgi:uncharacterized protein (DUF2267 family)